MLHSPNETLKNPVSGSAPIWPVVFKFGLIGALINISIDLFSFYQGTKETNTLDTGPLLGFFFIFLSIALYILCMLYAVKSYRDKYNGGFISLGRGMLVAYLTGVLISFVALAFRLLYLFVIDPEYMNRITQKSLGELTPPTFDFPMWTILARQLSGVALGLFIGVVFALIVSAVLQRSKASTIS